MLCISLSRKCGGDIFDILAQSGKYLHSTAFIHLVTQFSFSLLKHSLNTPTLRRTRASENQSSCHIMSAFWGCYRRKKCFRPLGLELLGSRYSRAREMPAEVSYCHQPIIKPLACSCLLVRLDQVSPISQFPLLPWLREVSLDWSSPHSVFCKCG